MMKTWNEFLSGSVNLSQEKQLLVCVWNQSPEKRLLFGLLPLLFSKIFWCKKLFLKDPKRTVAILAYYSSRLHSTIRLESLEIPVRAGRVKFNKLFHYFFSISDESHWSPGKLTKRTQSNMVWKSSRSNLCNYSWDICPQIFILYTAILSIIYVCLDGVNLVL